MRSLFVLSLVPVLVHAALSPEQVATLPPPAARGVDFAKDIQPLFEAACVKCHAKGKAKGDFSLETRDAFIKGGETGVGAVVGKSAQSYVVELVAGLDPDSVMPKKGTRWTPAQVGLLRAWIDQGAKWPPNVTFAKPEPQNLKPLVVALPSSPDVHPVDKLLTAYAADHGVSFPPVVDDRTFARRAYLDLIGLLPTPDQLEAFLADSVPGKRERLVRALLADKRSYTENWLTFWNDLLRNDYKGTGFIDGGRRQLSGWLYESLFANKRYDRFVAELIAPPDEKSEPFTRGIIWRGVVNASMLQPMQAAQNVSQVFLGVNLKCASCHDSFVNDWALSDAYGVAAIYSDDPLELVHCDKPTGKIASPRSLYPQLGALDGKLERPARMARFAELMTGGQNGRLSRSIVNRLWARLLGRGLVEPLDDMDHAAWSPEIIDYLAEDLASHGYDLKRTIGLIVTSRAYQLPPVEGPKDDKQVFAFRGPLTRRLTAEQFADAVASLTGDWPRMPATTDIDFAACGMVLPPELPTWIWSPEPNEIGEFRRGEAEALKALGPVPPTPPKKDKRPEGNPADLLKHKVVFRKTLKLEAIPADAQAVLLSSQAAFVTVNGARPKTTVADQSRASRIALMDITKLLRAGENVIAIDVQSHTDKGPLNDEEKKLYPNSQNHLNSIPGIAFYARLTDCCGATEIVTDATWRVRRVPKTGWDSPAYDDAEWFNATELPEGVTPVDEGPALPPIRRKDYANQKVELGSRLRPAVGTVCFPGNARAALRPADPLAIALDRPNREQVTTARLSAATTLQALELVNGETLDAKLALAGKRLADGATENVGQWVDQIYLHLLSRKPVDAERTALLAFLGEKPTPAQLSDALWSLVLLPEFQLIN